MPDTTPSPFTASSHTTDGKLHILLAATGSVATIKLPLIAESLSRHHHPNISIRIILTESATTFLSGNTPEQPSLSQIQQQTPAVEAIYRDADEWSRPWTRGAPILHIELRKWADLLLVAPLSANSLAKMTMGVADGLVLSVLRAWDTTGEVDGGVSRSGFGFGLGKEEGKRKRKRKRVFVAPAMNTAMWLHPVTERSMRVLREEWGVKDGEGEGDGWITVLEPMEKGLACGDVGIGGMMDWREIVATVESYANLKP